MTQTVYTKELRELLPGIYNTIGAFNDALSIEVMDGVRDADNAFYLKKAAQPVTINTYDPSKGTDEDSAFGTLVKQTYTDVPATYSIKLAANIGLDKFTVNEDMEVAVADTMEQISRGQMQKLNTEIGKILVAAAGKTISDAKDVNDMFNQAAKEMDEKEVIGTRIAYVSPDTRALLVDNGLTTSAKGSTIDINANVVEMFKGFVVKVVPSTYLGSDVDAIFTVAGVGRSYIGIQTMRALDEVPGFDGTQVQMAAKAGAIVPEVNKPAVIVAKVATLPEA